MKRNRNVEDRRRHQLLNRMLLDRQTEIQHKLRSLRETLPAKATDVKDAEEQSMEDFVRDMDVALMQMESETLRKIDEALLKLEAGSYGVCTSCEATISEARLQALPFATLCRECQEREEEDERAARTTGRRSVYDEPPPRAEAARMRSTWTEPAIARTIRVARAR